jgi:hypothetical protein
MNPILLELATDFASGIDFTQPAQEAVNWGAIMVGNPAIIVIALILIGVTIFLFFFLKRILVNSAIGLVLWAILTFVFPTNLPTIPSLIISILFGAAGIGAMLVLKFLGVF